MAGWHDWLDGREFEWTLGVGDGQGGLACCGSWGRKELDMTEWLNWTEAEPQWAPGLVFSDCVDFSVFDCIEYNQSDFGTDHLVMSMCRVISCIVWRGYLVWPICFLGEALLAFALLRFVFKAKLVSYSRYLLTSYFCIPIPYDEKDIFVCVCVCVSSRRSCRSS